MSGRTGNGCRKKYTWIYDGGEQLAADLQITGKTPHPHHSLARRACLCASYVVVQIEQRQIQEANTTKAQSQAQPQTGIALTAPAPTAPASTGSVSPRPPPTAFTAVNQVKSIFLPLLPWTFSTITWLPVVMRQRTTTCDKAFPDSSRPGNTCIVFS